jgi:hypothetical protein
MASSSRQENIEINMVFNYRKSLDSKAGDGTTNLRRRKSHL